VPIVCHRCRQHWWQICRRWQVATGVVDIDGKFAAGVVDTGANLPPVSTTLAKLVEKFAAGVIDTSGKLAAGVVDTDGAP
jgi:hypothetical protein